MIIAHRGGLRLRILLAAAGAYAAMAALYPLSNFARFGSALNTGYQNCTSGHIASAGMRWGEPYSLVSLQVALKEQFAILFLLDPTPQETAATPASIQKYVVADRYRQFASPTPIQGRWKIDGVGLPRDVLEKVYFRNACRLFGVPLSELGVSAQP